MNREVLLGRIQEIRVAVEQSANNHNALLGRLAEATHLFQEFERLEAETLATSENSLKDKEPEAPVSETHEDIPQ